jgi:hypothetical protein
MPTVLTEDPEGSRTRVLYIGGAGRSGSTLLCRVIGSADDVFAGGELRYIWDRGLRDNQLCSCGAPFRSCPFWSAVFQKAFGGFDWLDADSMLQAQKQVDRLRYIPLLTHPRLRTRAFGGRLDRYCEAMGRLYDAITAVSGASLVVDSSLDPSYAFFLAASPAIELELVHLVRDSRAVAFSWRRHRTRPEIHSRVEYVPRWSVPHASRNWLVANLLVAELSRRTPSVRVRYEDYTCDPSAVHDRLGELFGLPWPALARGAFELQAPTDEHLIAGNPMRFDKGPIRIRPDDEWARCSAPSSFVTATLHTWPLLVHYGYPVLSPLRGLR